ncbi:MAG: diaminopimelate decarboxylase [Myxococcales bacterium]|nr:diaminopimelate decarboxylase [Myxococcales bacterium]
MSGFARDERGGATLGGRSLAELLEEARIPTPAYFYDLDGISRATRELVTAFDDSPGLVAYAVKANTAGSVVRAVAAAGGGADVVSGGELEVALGASMPPDRIVMSGVAKLDWELDLAISRDIRAIQLESVEEVARVAARARALGKTARVSLRINPDVEIDSHAHIATGHDEAKFGIVARDLPAAFAELERAGDAVRLAGLSTHVGSMLATPAPYLESARVVCRVARERLEAGNALEFVDFGGGFGIDYGGAPVDAPPAFVHAALALLREQGLGELALVVEPGRALVAPFGVLVASVVQSKQSGTRRWCLIDAGMNDLIRPALYAARHRIEPLERPPSAPEWQVVGPVCESADDFGLHALGPSVPAQVVLRDAGAYGFTMASEYNGRALPAEVFVRQGKVAHVSASPGVQSWVKRRLEA